MRFEVEFKGTITINADSLEQANLIMSSEHSYYEPLNFYDLDTKEDHKVIGTCEISELSIFEGDDFLSDDKGVMWLKEFDDL